MSIRAYIGLGANLGDAAGTVQAAMQGLATLPTTRLIATSSLYRSAPVGYLEQPDFINAVAVINTDLTPYTLLDGLLALEELFGRQRSFRNAPRTLDMDLLLYGDAVMHDKRLTVPHPRMRDRSFVLVPLHEIAADLHLPDGSVLAELVASCDRTGLHRL
ncbi:2-amino-4-hydroxy-6-hydroxymethyldihydropteridine diphosphokinase [Chitinimonas sp. PSY-7]|uniref:2-amino-4-hydroxy-6- hydroxymethyldihydropteridine diphosphokinase n=1 Tax=Chitinimonas sp. PSY-7 TaxID=3459088 RepID=UPI00403FF0E7